MVRIEVNMESELDRPIAAISSPASDGDRQKPEISLGEFSVGVEGHQSK
jgi:hypothetical protein